jgi:hypothetical protein
MIKNHISNPHKLFYMIVEGFMDRRRGQNTNRSSQESWEQVG